MYINNNIFNFKNKQLIVILNKIYGINTHQAQYILNYLGYNKNLIVKNLTQLQLQHLNEIIAKYYVINLDLQYQQKTNIKQKILINTYRGIRLNNKLPSHGQNTHSNGKTAKKK